MRGFQKRPLSANFVSLVEEDQAPLTKESFLSGRQGWPLQHVECARRPGF